VPKSTVRRQISQGALALRAVMEENLSFIGQSLVDQVMSRLSRLPESQRMKAIDDLELKGVMGYKERLLAALAVVAFDALKAVRLEVPAAKNVKLAEDEDAIQLGEFEKLPASIRNKVFKQYQLLAATQLVDLEKAVKFQFNHSVDSTDSMNLIRADLEDAAFEYTTGPRILAGAASMAAQVINETRNSFFDTDEVQEEIEAFEFVNGDPVSAICNDLAGTIFDKNDPNRFRYTPPLHFNCKSYIVPILSGNLRGREVTDLKPSTQKLEDSIQFSEALCGCQLHVVAEPTV
jgi:hypothetical protein